MPTHWTRNKKLVLAWTIFSFFFLSSSIVLGVTSQIWRIQSDSGILDGNTLRNLSIRKGDLSGEYFMVLEIEV